MLYERIQNRGPHRSRGDRNSGIKTNLTFSYRKMDVNKVIENLLIRNYYMEIMAIIGPKGCGKTHFMIFWMYLYHKTGVNTLFLQQVTVSILYLMEICIQQTK